MHLLKIAPAAAVLLAALSLTLPALPVARADDADGKGSFDSAMYPDSPDPMEPTFPGYWEGGQHAGGTGSESEDLAPPYTEGGQHAGGTGEAADPNPIPYWEGGNQAGAF